MVRTGWPGMSARAVIVSVVLLSCGCGGGLDAPGSLQSTFDPESPTDRTAFALSPEQIRALDEACSQGVGVPGLPDCPATTRNVVTEGLRQLPGNRCQPRSTLCASVIRAHSVKPKALKPPSSPAADPRQAR